MSDEQGENRATGSLTAEPLNESDWRILLSMARHERLLGLLARAAADGALPTTVEQSDELHEENLKELCRDLICEQELIEIVRVLRNSGLDHRVLKGSAVAHLDYPEPALRSFGDVDLLVRANEWDDAITVLAAAGWQRQFSEPRPGFDRRFIKGVVLTRDESGAGTELDLHRTLALGPFGLTVQLEDLWDAYDVLPVGGEELRCLEAEKRFLHACFHALLGGFPPRLVPLRDIAQMSLNKNLDLDLVIDLSRSWRAESVLANAVRFSWSTLDLDRSAEPWIRTQSLRPPKRELATLSPYLSPRRSYVRLCVASIRAIQRPSDKARYLLALAFPERQFIGSRYRSRVHRWLAAAQVLRSGRARRSRTNWRRAA